MLNEKTALGDFLAPLQTPAGGLKASLDPSYPVKYDAKSKWLQ